MNILVQALTIGAVAMICVLLLTITFLAMLVEFRAFIKAVRASRVKGEPRK